MLVHAGVGGEMKVFIVFFAMLIINISFLSYNSDMDRYVKLQTHLKALAEESAAGASLFYDQEAYSKGSLYFDRESATEYVNFLVENAECHYPIFSEGYITSEEIFFDDMNGYAASQGYNVQKESPAVVVTLTYCGQDVFRLPFICVQNVSRTATYQWDEGLTSLF
jgi:hypothetical protein